MEISQVELLKEFPMELLKEREAKLSPRELSGETPAEISSAQAAISGETLGDFPVGTPTRFQIKLQEGFLQRRKILRLNHWISLSCSC